MQAITVVVTYIFISSFHMYLSVFSLLTASLYIYLLINPPVSIHLPIFLSILPHTLKSVTRIRYQLIFAHCRIIVFL